MSRSGTTIVTPHDSEKPKKLFDVISMIERYAYFYLEGADISDKYITMKDRLDYFSLGLRSQLTGAFVTALLAPLSMGVIKNYIAIFGVAGEPDMIAKVYAYLLSFGLSLGFAIFFAYVGKYYIGKAARVIIFNLYVGVTVGAVIKLFLATLLYSTVYFIVLTESNIFALLDRLERYNVTEHAIGKIYYILYSIRTVMIPTAYLVLVSTVIFIIIPWVSVVYTAYKQKIKEI